MLMSFCRKWNRGSIAFSIVSPDVNNLPTFQFECQSLRNLHSGRVTLETVESRPVAIYSLSMGGWGFTSLMST